MELLDRSLEALFSFVLASPPSRSESEAIAS